MYDSCRCLLEPSDVLSGSLNALSGHTGLNGLYLGSLNALFSNFLNSLSGPPSLYLGSPMPSQAFLYSHSLNTLSGPLRPSQSLFRLSQYPLKPSQPCLFCGVP